MAVSSDITNMPTPTLTPSAAVTQRLAAVVRPCTLPRFWIMARAKNTYALYELCGDAPRIPGAEAVTRYDREQRGAPRHHPVAAHTCRFPDLFTLDTDESAQGGGHDQSREHVGMESQL